MDRIVKHVSAFLRLQAHGGCLMTRVRPSARLSR